MFVVISTIKLKNFPSTWNDGFALLDGSYSISEIQYYFAYIIKILETLAENAPVQICTNKIKKGLFLKYRHAINYNYYLVNQWDYEKLQKRCWSR